MRRKLLVVFVDALGPEQLAHASDLFSFVPHRRALGGVLGYSSGALATVLTGVEPSRHGRMCLFTRRDEADEPILAPLAWLGLLPRLLHERGPVRRALARALARVRGLTGYVALHRVPPEAFRWLDIPERDDLFRADSVGGAPTFLADARGGGLSVYASPWQIPEAERFEMAQEHLRRRPPDLAFLYATALDGALHACGNDAASTRGALSTIASQVERARDAMAKGGSDVRTIVVGDHGMADVDRVVDPRPVLARMHLAKVFVDSTMLRVWGARAELDKARLALEAAAVPGVWLDRQALADRGAPVRGSPYGDGIFVLSEGTIFAPSFVGGRVAGMHGYDLGSRSASAAIASDVPLPDPCASLADLAPLVRRELGLFHA